MEYMDKKINVAIDGPSGSGKGITSKLLANKLGYNYLDTGAMYRAVGLYLDDNEIMPDNVCKDDLKCVDVNFDENNNVLLNGKNIENEIRTARGDKLSSLYSKIGVVRDFLGKLQKKIVKKKGFVAEGRDIGSVIMPDAEVKIYLTASIKARATRRFADFEKKGLDITLKEVEKQLEERDYDDMNRDIAPLKQLDEAIVVNTTYMNIDEQVDYIYNIAIDIVKKNKYYN